jgi:adenylate cyclase
MLVEFAGAIDAARCFVEIQCGMAERNASVPAEEQIGGRIGINVGDTIYDEQNNFGDGVNMDSRLEALASRATMAIIRNAGRPVRRCGPE